MIENKQFNEKTIMNKYKKIVEKKKIIKKRIKTPKKVFNL